MHVDVSYSRRMKLQSLVILILSVARCYSDYVCVCNYNVEKGVYPDKSTSNLPLGYIYEFDCKSVVDENDTAGPWVEIAYKHSYGYIEIDSQTEVQTCPGDPDPDDIVTTTYSVLSTTMSMSASTETPTTSSGTTHSPPLSSHTASTTSKITSTKTSMTTGVVTESSSLLPVTTLPASSTTSSMISVSSSMISSTADSSSTSTPLPTTHVVSSSSTVKTSSPLPSMTSMLQSTSAASSSVQSSTPLVSTMSPTTVITNSSATYGCSRNITQIASAEQGLLFTYGQYCYELVQVKKIWEEAELSCQRRGGHLVHIANAQEQTAIYNFVQTNHGDHGVWIGLHDRGVETNYEWTSGDPVAYTNWDSGSQATSSHAIEDCVGMGVQATGYAGGTWEDLRCGIELHYICQFDATLVEATASPTFGVYSDGDISLCPLQVRQIAMQAGTLLVQHGNSCYELLHNKVSWGHAEAFCQDANGHLAQISSAEEQAFVQAFMQHHNPNKAVWIGLHDQNYENYFEWTSGEPVTYTNWIPGHVSNFESHHTEDCTALIPYKNGQWDDIPCGDDFLLGLSFGESHLSFCEYAIHGSF